MIFENSPSEHPFELSVIKNESKHRIRVYIWNLTHGGGRNRPDDEYRVQFISTAELVTSPSVVTLVLGYWAENGHLLHGM